MVAASKHRFTNNPFTPPHRSEVNKNLAVSIDAFIDRSRRDSEEAYLSPDNRYYKMIEQAMAMGESDANIYQLRRSYVREKKQGLCPTLTANMGIGGHNIPFVRDTWGIRRLSIGEVAKLQGFDMVDSLFPEIPIAEQYRLLGNAVCVGLARQIGEICLEILQKEAATYEQ